MARLLIYKMDEQRPVKSKDSLKKIHSIFCANVDALRSFVDLLSPITINQEKVMSKEIKTLLGKYLPEGFEEKLRGKKNEQKVILIS